MQNRTRPSRKAASWDTPSGISTTVIGASSSASCSWRERDVGETDPAGQPLALDPRECAHARRQRDAGVRSVEEEHVEWVPTRCLETRLTGAEQRAGPAVGSPDRPVANETTLRHHHDTRRVALPRRQRVRDQALVVTRVRIVEPVGACGVEQRHAGVERGMDRRESRASRRGRGLSKAACTRDRRGAAPSRSSHARSSVAWRRLRCSVTRMKRKPIVP